MADQDPKATPSGGPMPGASAVNAEDVLSSAQQDIDAMVREAQSAAGGDGATPLELPAFPDQGPAVTPETIDLLADVSLNVKIELGRTSMLLEDVLRLSEGAVVELDKLAGDPVDIYVNDRPVARGEVLVMNDNFCVRVHEILSDSAPAKAPSSRGGR